MRTARVWHTGPQFLSEPTHKGSLIGRAPHAAVRSAPTGRMGEDSMSTRERPFDEDEFLDDERRIFEIAEKYLGHLQAGQVPDRDAILAVF